MYYLDTVEGMGRGLFASHDIKAGTVLFRAEVLVLNSKDTKTVNETDLKYYTFKYNESQDCLVLGDGEIFNHADKPNVGYTLVDFKDEVCPRKVMVFATIKDIKQGDQLFIDYNADTDVNPDDYKINLV